MLSRLLIWWIKKLWWQDTILRALGIFMIPLLFIVPVAILSPLVAALLKISLNGIIVVIACILMIFSYWAAISLGELQNRKDGVSSVNSQLEKKIGVMQPRSDMVGKCLNGSVGIISLLPDEALIQINGLQVLIKQSCAAVRWQAQINVLVETDDGSQYTALYKPQPGQVIYLVLGFEGLIVSVSPYIQEPDI